MNYHGLIMFPVCLYFLIGIALYAMSNGRLPFHKVILWPFIFRDGP
jgi:hypothetical protein